MLKTINKEEFARRLFIFRESRGLTKVETAKLANVSRNTYAEWENPKSDSLPGHLNNYYALSQALGFGAHFMMYGRLEHERDARYTERVDKFYQRQRAEPDFNALTHLIQEMTPDAVKFLVSFLQEQKKSDEAEPNEAEPNEAEPNERPRKKISRPKSIVHQTDRH